MSLWQHKNIHKKHLLWAKLFGFCLFFHLVVLLWVFCVYRDNSYMLAISVNKNMDYSAPIMFVPSYTPALRKATVDTTKNTQKTIVKKATVIQVKPTAQKKTPTPQKPPTVAAAAPKKTTEPIKKELPKIEPKVEPKIEPQKIDQKIAPFIPEDAQISHNYREVEALRCGAQLQKELVQKWKPPIGVSPECICEISFFVTTSGVIEELKMIKSSGVMMYDISARQALFAMKMPPWTHGKPLVISFKQ